MVNIDYQKILTQSIVLAVLLSVVSTFIVNAFIVPMLATTGFIAEVSLPLAVGTIVSLFIAVLIIKVLAAYVPDVQDYI